MTEWPDVAALERILEWDRSAPAVIARAPGRLDVMGGIADYSGSLVLELPLREATCVALQRHASKGLSVWSASKEYPFVASFEDLEGLDYGTSAWAAYVAGAFVVLMQERNVVFPGGARLAVRSDVPEGKGVASSAALSVSSMMAIDGAYDLGLTPREVAFHAQKVENFVVGAPCGIMDQMTAVFGEKDRLLALLCQPAELQQSIAVPEGLAFWGIDSGKAHAVSGDAYGSVRVGAFMGYRILEEQAGHDFGGYLANVEPSELEERYLARLPETMRGSDFIDRFGETRDTVTAVDPSFTYPVRAPTVHPIYEHSRVRAFARLLRGNAIENAPLLGELMYESHQSYSACGLGAEGTDRLVELARDAGPARGIYGAKITGGGSGGTVAVLARRDAADNVMELARRYGNETGVSPIVFDGSSPGALRFGHHVVKPAP